jgi:hypothetical protein
MCVPRIIQGTYIHCVSTELRVFGNWVLGRIFGPTRDEELNDLYSSPNIVRVIKSRRIRWAGHVARMGAKRGV